MNERMNVPTVPSCPVVCCLLPSPRGSSRERSCKTWLTPRPYSAIPTSTTDMLPPHTLPLFLLSDNKTESRMNFGPGDSGMSGSYASSSKMTLPPPKMEPSRSKRVFIFPWLWTTLNSLSRFYLIQSFRKFDFILTHRYLKTLSCLSIFVFWNI